MGSRSVIRVWWGDKTDPQTTRVKNRKIMERTLLSVMKDSNQEPFVTYVYGQDNYEYLKSVGLEDLVLVDPDPSPRKRRRRERHHRLDLCKAAFVDFDEIVCINWSCRQVRPLPSDFWSRLNGKESLQAMLIKTRVRMVRSRINSMDQKTFPADGFLYLRDKTFPDKLLDLLSIREVSNKWTCESLIAHYLDRLYGGWIGKEKYYDLYEPECVRIDTCSVYPKSLKPNVCFKFRSKFA